MTKEYFINGMSCGSCVAKVKEALKKVEGVDTVEVQLQSPQATINMQNEVPVKNLQSALKDAGHYAITDSGKVAEYDNKKAHSGCCC
jgi:copper chaperone CopZ